MSTPSIEQLLNLADRAEYGGGLTQAEADRLRAGIRSLDDKCRSLYGSKQSASLRHFHRARREQEASKRLRAVAALVTAARHRGARSVSVQTLSLILTAPVEFGGDEERPASRKAA